MSQLQVAADKPLLICLMGPTASGKTDLAVELARQRNCELISVDSALVYRGLDIGSAKPDFPHHLIDIRDPQEVYSAAEFAADASRLCVDIIDRGKTPLLVGGSMLYFRAFLEGLAPMPGADPAIRADIEALAAQRGWEHIHMLLAAVDPESAARIHPRHSQRLSRALEVYRVSGITLSDWHRRGGQPAPGLGIPVAARCRVVQLALCPADRAVLHQRIAQRFDLMMDAGLLDEVRRLRAQQGLHPDLPAMRAVGYRQLWHYLDGDYSLELALEKAVAATRQLAKRQLTWLRKWPDLAWIYTDRAGNLQSTTWSGEARIGAEEKPLAQVLNYLDQPQL